MQTTNDILNGPDFSEILVILGAYLSNAADEGAYFGGYSGEDALIAFQQLLGWSDEKMIAFVKIFQEQ